MSATPPEAKTEYSRGFRRSRRPPEPPDRAAAGARGRSASRSRTPASAAGMAILAGGVAGAALLLVAEFTPLFHVYAPRTGARVDTVGTGSHHAFAMIPIALLGDLTDAHASGLIGSSSARFIGVSSAPAMGMYLETLAAALLLITSVCGWLWLGAVANASSPAR